jgi:hypothetical protein
VTMPAQRVTIRYSYSPDEVPLGWPITMRIRLLT